MAKKQKKERATRRHRILYKTLSFLLSWILVLKANFKYKKLRFKETPTILLSNHNSDWDPLFLGCAVKDFMYYVASEHVYRWGFFSKIIEYVFDPIIRVKGTTEARDRKSVV